MSNHDLIDYLKQTIERMELHTLEPSRLRQYTIFIADQKSQDIDEYNTNLMLKYLFIGYYVSTIMDNI